MSLKSTVNLNVSSTHNNPVVYRGQKTGTTVGSRNVSARSSALPITTGAQLNTACVDQYRAGGGGAYTYCSLALTANNNTSMMAGSRANLAPLTRSLAMIGSGGDQNVNVFIDNSALTNLDSAAPGAAAVGSDTQACVGGVYQVQSVSTSASNVAAAQGNTMVLNTSDSVAPLGGSGPFQSITLDLCGPDDNPTGALVIGGSGADRQVIVLHPRDVTMSTATTVTDAGPNNTLNRALHYLRVIDLPSPATMTQPVTQAAALPFMTGGERHQYPTTATILQPLTPGTATPTQPARIVLEKSVANAGTTQIPYSRHIIQVVQKPPLYTGMGGAVQVPMP